MNDLYLRREFPLLERQRYLNFGSSGPMAMSVVKKMCAHLANAAKEGPSSPWFMQRYLREYVELKKSLAAFLNASPDEIAITQNTTEGINIILRGLDWKAGDEIVTTEFEHPGLTVPLERLRVDYQVRIKTAAPEKIAGALTPKVKMVAVSHVNFITGMRLPIADIAAGLKRRNILLLVDGAQAAGAVPLDMRRMGCDFYSFPAHKWLLGPRGMGCLYVAKRRIKAVGPVFTGWCSVNNIGPGAVVSARGRQKENVDSSDFAKGAGRYAVSTWSTAGVAGFLEGLAIFRKYFEKRLKFATNDIAFFKRELVRIPGVELLSPEPADDSAGIVSFRIKHAPSLKLAQRLISLNIIVRYLPEADCVRCCYSAVNTPDDLKAVIAALKKIVIQKRHKG